MLADDVLATCKTIGLISTVIHPRGGVGSQNNQTDYEKNNRA